MHYAVERISQRRVRPDDGVLEYKTHWAGYSDAVATWEPRGNMTENCAQAVQTADQVEMEVTDARIAQWREARHRDRDDATRGAKRARSADSATNDSKDDVEDGKEEVEVLSGVLVRGTGVAAQKSGHKATHTPQHASQAGVEPASVVMLGELVLTDTAAAFLANPTKRGRRGNGSSSHRGNGGEEETPTPELCASAVGLERAWRERFAVSPMHSWVGSSERSPLPPNFSFQAGAACVEAERRLLPGDVEILGLAPVEVTKGGQPFRKPFTFVPWIGEEEAERLRRESVANYPSLGPAAQDLLRLQREHMVVRYAVADGKRDDTTGPGEGEGAEGRELPTRPHRAVASMPLSVFREVFPQLLLDYLLEHAIVLEA